MKPRSGKVRPGQTSPGPSKPWRQLNWGPMGVASLHSSSASTSIWVGMVFFFSWLSAEDTSVGGWVRRDRDGRPATSPYRTMEPLRDAGE